MSGCHPIEMPVCEHCVPVKYHCNKCALNKMSLNAWGEVEIRPVSPIIEQMQKLEERINNQELEIKRLKERIQEIWATT